MNKNTIEYALLSGSAYRSSRPALGNRVSVPLGWVELDAQRNLSSGFEVVAYQKGSEIVISYAGTNFNDLRGDLTADAVLGLGSEQLHEA